MRTAHHPPVPQKRYMHITCGTCINACPEFCIRLGGKEIVIDLEHCIGCLMCMNTCPKHAIDIDWRDDGAVFVERMIKYAAGAVANKTGKAYYINFLTNITPHCDCTPWNDIPIVPDIGILASRDPVIVGSLLPDHYREGERSSLASGREMGLGRAEYQLKEI
ncbi:MAG TPA: DUF362 domain-containing protein [Methanocorpusculum sp.]|nr:DUF362 domain-containing protein [Methanocorpusculum sp.]